jgi:hypothetical protein
MLRRVPDESIEIEAEAFAFWTKSEVTRIGCLMSLALAPLSFAAIDTPHDASAASPFEAVSAAPSQQQSGFLRSVRTIDFNASRFDMKAMGDVE